MDMKTCIFLTLGLLVGSGSGYSIDRPAGSTDNLQPPPLTPYAHQVKPLPSSKPARLGIVPGTVPQALVAQLELSGFPGVLVTKVMPDSPAAKAGLQENDVMVKLGDVSLSGPQSVTEALSEKVPGDRIPARSPAQFLPSGVRRRLFPEWLHGLISPGVFWICSR